MDRRRIICVLKIYTTTYHPQINIQAKRVTIVILSVLGPYPADCQRTEDDYTDALSYAYDTQLPANPSFALFEILLVRPSTSLILKARLTAVRKLNPGQRCLPGKQLLVALANTANQQLRQAEDR